MNAACVIIFGLLFFLSSNGVLSQSVVGITATGKTMVASDGKVPWFKDIRKRASIVYPLDDKRNYHQGKGLFVISFDLRTGAVTEVATKKSTGWATLDAAAISGLRQVRIKPGTWRQFPFFVTFEMARNRDDFEERIRQSQNKDKPREKGSVP